MAEEEVAVSEECIIRGILMTWKCFKDDSIDSWRQGSLADAA